VSSPFDELAAGVYRRRYASLDLNIGVVVGADGILIVDSRASHSQAQELRDELADLTALPVRWLVNTHWHWDHVFGNAMFPEARLWGQRECRNHLIEHGEEEKAAARELVGPEHAHLIDEVVITPPEYVVGTARAVDVGGRTVTLDHMGLGHTNSDLVVTVSDAPVLFAGDLLEESAPPHFGDSYPMAWPDTVDRLRDHVRGVVVPGHGDVMDAAAVTTQYEELTAVARACADGLATGRFDAAAGPYPEDTMRTAWERARLEYRGRAEG
jgi:glyoxylase-like metal-dependent hydrolase (beta-lactamase superfamily II)